MGVWGSGIAAQFYEYFHEAFEGYRDYCIGSQDPETIVGTCWVSDDTTYRLPVACLLTSKGYGSNRDSKDEILHATSLALQDFFEDHKEVIQKYKVIHSPKINAGLFGVPWEETEAVIKRLLPEGVKWVVFEL
jgi:ADP-ribose 1''-phosphate phosphatase